MFDFSGQAAAINVHVTITTCTFLIACKELWVELLVINVCIYILKFYHRIHETDLL